MDICMLYDNNYVCIGHLKNLLAKLHSRREEDEGPGGLGAGD